MIKVDYHFHPNLSLFSWRLACRKARKIWQAFKENQLDVVFVAEHAYKKPRTSYEILKASRPEGAKTHLVPAIESVSKEGVDLIVFSKYPEQIFAQKELLEPYGLSIKEMIGIIKNNNGLYGIVVHPFTPGVRGIVQTCGLKQAVMASKNLGFLEKHNCSVSILKRLLEETRLNKLLKKKYISIAETHTIPKYLKKEAKIMTVGSDAHHISGIGDCAKIEAEYRDDYDYLFEVVLAKEGKLYEKQNKPFYYFIQAGLTFISEIILGRLKISFTDKPYAQKNSAVFSR